MSPSEIVPFLSVVAKVGIMCRLVLELVAQTGVGILKS